MTAREKRISLVLALPVVLLLLGIPTVSTVLLNRTQGGAAGFAGTAGMPGYKNYYHHFRGFLIGTVLTAIIGAIIAGVVRLSQR